MKEHDEYVLIGYVSISDLGFAYPFYSRTEVRNPNRWYMALSDAFSETDERILDFLVYEGRDIEDIAILPEENWLKVRVGEPAPAVFLLDGQFIVADKSLVYSELLNGRLSAEAIKSYPLVYLNALMLRQNVSAVEHFTYSRNHVNTKYGKRTSEKWAKNLIKDFVVQKFCRKNRISSLQFEEVKAVSNSIDISVDEDNSRIELRLFASNGLDIGEFDKELRDNLVAKFGLTSVKTYYGSRPSYMPPLGLVVLHGRTLSEVALASEAEKSGETSIEQNKRDDLISKFRNEVEEWRLSMRQLADESEPGKYEVELAKSLVRLGELESDPNILLEAIGHLKSVVKFKISRKEHPIEWAAAQNELGNSLFRLGSRESGTIHFSEAISAYREALRVRTRADHPIEWAASMNNLANALRDLGIREGGTLLLSEAVTVYQAVLEVRTKTDKPILWAGTKNNLGVALKALGEREGNLDFFIDASEIFRQALEVRTPDTRPLEAAATQYNLGDTLFKLGQRTKNVASVTDAVTIFRSALERLSVDKEPLDRATVAFSLGESLFWLTSHSEDPSYLTEAKAAFAEAYAIFVEAKAYQYQEVTVARLHRVEQKIRRQPFTNY